MRVELTPQVKLRLKAELRRAGYREIGGILFAKQIAPSKFRVIDFSVERNTGSSTHFVRDPNAHRAATEDFFRRTGHDYGQFNYLGEWHSHPQFSVQPSTQDLETMTELVEGSPSGITFSVLLVFRLGFFSWLHFSATIFAKGFAPQSAKVGPIVRIRWI